MIHPLTNGYRTCPESAETREATPGSTIWPDLCHGLLECLKGAVTGACFFYMLYLVAVWAGY